MAKRGRKSQPTTVKKAKGNPGRRPLPENEPLPEALESVPPAPSFLDARGKRHWKAYGEELLECGLLTKADLPAFGTYCQCYATWLKALDDIKENGSYKTAPNGYPVYNPSVSFRDKAITQMKSFWSEFGMTPSSRTGIKVEPKKKDDGDALDKLIKESNLKVVK